MATSSVELHARPHQQRLMQIVEVHIKERRSCGATVPMLVRGLKRQGKQHARISDADAAFGNRHRRFRWPERMEFPYVTTEIITRVTLEPARAYEQVVVLHGIFTSDPVPRGMQYPVQVSGQRSRSAVVTRPRIVVDHEPLRHPIHSRKFPPIGTTARIGVISQ